MSEIKNIIWILVDSVRNYHTSEDDRGRLDVMDEFSKKSIEFDTAITSAPSTVMSVSSMMTGIPSIFQSRTYNDFTFNKDSFCSLPHILFDNQFNINSVIFFPEGRNFLKSLFINISEEYWTDNAHELKFWSNETVFDIGLNILNDINKDENNFIYTHFNCRHDPNTSETVKKYINELEKRGYLNNSIIILNSDHGYPDPSRAISSQDKILLGHDLILSDDNILTPFFLYYPGCHPNKISKPISTLDIMPTILELIGKKEEFSNSNFPIHGISLLPFLNNFDKTYKTKKIRTDNRFIFQDNKVMSLRDDKYKLIYFYDQDISEFYDLKIDSEEKNNRIKDIKYASIIDTFIKEKNIQEEQIFSFHKKHISNRLESILKSNQSIAIVGKSNNKFYKMMIQELISLNCSRIFLYPNMYNILRNDHSFWNNIDDNKVQKIQKIFKIDLAIAVFEDNNPINRIRVSKEVGRLKTKKNVYVNYNFDYQERPKSIIYYFIKYSYNLFLKMIFRPQHFFSSLLSSYHKVKKAFF